MVEVKRIKWDVDMDDVYAYIDEMTCKKAAAALELPADTYANMTTDERHDYVYQVCRKSSRMKYELLGLPTKVKLPKKMEHADDDEISDWLSEKYQYCHKGFALSTD